MVEVDTLKSTGFPRFTCTPILPVSATLKTSAIMRILNGNSLLNTCSVVDWYAGSMITASDLFNRFRKSTAGGTNDYNREKQTWLEIKMNLRTRISVISYFNIIE